MACDHGMMLMSDHDDAYVDAMLMVNMQANTRSVTDCLKDFLLKQGFEIGKANPTLFTRKVNNDTFICQIYVDDIIFGSSNADFSEEFSRTMTKRFEMSMMGS